MASEYSDASVSFRVWLLYEKKFIVVNKIFEAKLMPDKYTLNYSAFFSSNTLSPTFCSLIHLLRLTVISCPSV